MFCIRLVCVKCSVCMNDTATTEIYTCEHTLSLLDALPISARLAMEPFGPIRQLGFVVRDLNQAIRAWTDIGVGPFYVAESPEISDQLSFGKPTASRARGAWSYAGKMQKIGRAHV